LADIYKGLMNVFNQYCKLVEYGVVDGLGTTIVFIQQYTA